MAELEFHAKDLANQMTINVKVVGYTGWRVRLWIALRLIEFAAWFAWVNIEVAED